MTRKYFYIFIGLKILYVIAMSASSGQGTGFIHLKGKQFVDENGQDFFPMICNYDLHLAFDQNSSANPPPIFITPTAWYNGSDAFECNDVVSCNTEFNLNFQEIADMGFNGIRFTGWHPIIEFDANDVANGITINAHGSNVWTTTYPVYFDAASINTPNLLSFEWSLILNIYDQLLTQAAAVTTDSGDPLKVILLFGAIKQFENQSSVDLYMKFMSVIANHLKNYTNLLAYDLYNEPGEMKNWPATGVPEKTWVCNTVNDLYDAVKNYDPNHLITLGGFGLHDVTTYDANMLKLDFYSLHVYPKGPDKGMQNLQDQWNGVMGELYWLSQTCNMPIIIGETGFRSKAGYGMSAGFDGDLNEMSTYMEYSLQTMLDCGYSGFSWWYFQDKANSMVPIHHWGLLSAGSAPFAPLRKPAISKVQSFNPQAPANPCLTPSNYTNPFNFQDPNPLTGQVRYHNGSIVQDAYIYGFGKYYNSQGRIDDFSSYTFTGENGGFTLYKKPFVDPIFPPPYFPNIRISAAGASVVLYGSWSGQSNDITIPVPGGNIYNLTYFNFDYDQTLRNDVIPSSSYRKMKGWSSLSMSDILIEGQGTFGATADFTARNEINIHDTFHAQQGSETHIFTSPTWSECADVINLNRIASPHVGQYSASLEREIELSFTGSAWENVQAFPNPSHGTFSVRISSGIELPASYTILDSFGKRLTSGLMNERAMTLDLSGEAPGLYLLSVLSENHYSIIKLINQAIK